MPLCWLLATSAGAYELMEMPCQIGKKKLETAQACAEKAKDYAEGGRHSLSKCVRTRRRLWLRC